MLGRDLPIMPDAQIYTFPLPETVTMEQLHAWKDRADYWTQQAEFAKRAYDYAEEQRERARAMLVSLGRLSIEE